MRSRRHGPRAKARRRACASLAVLIALAAASAGQPARAAASTAFIRVDQLGYSSGGAKRAYLMSSAPATGARWEVAAQAGGPVVASGLVGASSGSWSPGFPYVYPLALEGLSAPGSYVVHADGATSPPFQVGAPAEVFGPALANALSFYENERDGPEYIPSPLRSAPAHLHDSQAATYATPKVDGQGRFKGDLRALGGPVDAAGGWWDAGDYLKFVETASYTVDLMLAGVRDLPAQMGASAPAGRDFTAEARFGVEWLLRMWDDASGTLYYQVGIGAGNARTASDHDLWRLPQADDSYGGQAPLYRYIRNRPVFRAGAPGAPVSPNIAGRDAGAFALCYQVFLASDRTFADRCLSAAEHIYALADTRHRGRLLTAIPFGFYPETEWRDDMQLGAAEIALALQAAPPPQSLPHTEAGYYLSAGQEWAAAYSRHAHGGEGLNLYDVSGHADYELARALAAAGRPPAEQSALEAALAAKLQASEAQAAHDPFGFGYAWAAGDSASHGDGLAVMADEYRLLTGSERFAGLGRSALDGVLGANAWGVSMIVGDGSAFPHCPSHQVANLLGSLDGTAPVLAGAVVEGPNSEVSTGLVEGMRECPPGGGDPFAAFDGEHAVFADNAQSYTTTEPAIDLTASSLLELAYAAAGTP